MTRRAVPRLLLVLVALFGFSHPRAAERDAVSSRAILEQFLTLEHSTPAQYRALRRLEARTERFTSPAWMDVWTEADAGGFRYRIAAEGGSESIRDKVFRALLDREQKALKSGRPNHAALVPSNYIFADEIFPSDGLAKLGVTARRKDVLLVNGSIYLKPEDGDLVRLEGRLAKSPSFWTRRVDIVRRYRRLEGARVPVALESVADVMIYGKSTLTMTYEYESINGRRVGNPGVRAAGVAVP
jgi:hypothetical protein